MYHAAIFVCGNESCGPSSCPESRVQALYCPGIMKPVEGIAKRFSILDAVFTEIRIFPCHRAWFNPCATADPEKLGAWERSYSNQLQISM